MGMKTFVIDLVNMDVGTCKARDRSDREGLLNIAYRPKNSLLNIFKKVWLYNVPKERVFTFTVDDKKEIWHVVTMSNGHEGIFGDIAGQMSARDADRIKRENQSRIRDKINKDTIRRLSMEKEEAVRMAKSIEPKEKRDDMLMYPSSRRYHRPMVASEEESD